MVGNVGQGDLLVLVVTGNDIKGWNGSAATTAIIMSGANVTFAGL